MDVVQSARRSHEYPRAYICDDLLAEYLKHSVVEYSSYLTVWRSYFES